MRIGKFDDKYVVYLGNTAIVGKNITILHIADANHEALNWALAHAAPDSSIFLADHEIKGQIDFGLAEWSVTIK